MTTIDKYVFSGCIDTGVTVIPTNTLIPNSDLATFYKSMKDCIEEKNECNPSCTGASKIIFKPNVANPTFDQIFTYMTNNGLGGANTIHTLTYRVGAQINRNNIVMEVPANKCLKYQDVLKSNGDQYTTQMPSNYIQLKYIIAEQNINVFYSDNLCTTPITLNAPFELSDHYFKISNDQVASLKVLMSEKSNLYGDKVAPTQIILYSSNNIFYHNNQVNLFEKSSHDYNNIYNCVLLPLFELEKNTGFSSGLDSSFLYDESSKLPNVNLYSDDACTSLLNLSSSSLIATNDLGDAYGAVYAMANSTISTTNQLIYKNSLGIPVGNVSISQASNVVGNCNQQNLKENCVQSLKTSSQNLNIPVDSCMPLPISVSIETCGDSLFWCSGKVLTVNGSAYTSDLNLLFSDKNCLNTLVGGSFSHNNLFINLETHNNTLINYTYECYNENGDIVVDTSNTNSNLSIMNQITDLSGNFLINVNYNQCSEVSLGSNPLVYLSSVLADQITVYTDSLCSNEISINTDISSYQSLYVKQLSYLNGIMINSQGYGVKSIATQLSDNDGNVLNKEINVIKSQCFPLPFVSLSNSITKSFSIVDYSPGLSFFLNGCNSLPLLNLSNLTFSQDNWIYATFDNDGIFNITYKTSTGNGNTAKISGYSFNPININVPSEPYSIDTSVCNDQIQDGKKQISLELPLIKTNVTDGSISHAEVYVNSYDIEDIAQVVLHDSNTIGLKVNVTLNTDEVNKITNVEICSGVFCSPISDLQILSVYE